MLTIHKATDGENVTFALEGRFDMTTAPQVEKELEGVLKHARTLTFDLRDLDSINTTGLRVLLTAQKQMNQKGRMHIINVGEAVMQEMELRGLADIFNISDTEPE